MKKNKTALLFILSGLTICLSSCSFLTNFLDQLEEELNNSEGGNSNSNTNFDVEKTDVSGKTIINHTYKDYSNQSIYPIDSCPSLGNPKILIIPVWFKDSSKYISDLKKSIVRKDITTAYFGTNEETGWRSVKTYYEELSSGKLTLTGTVSQWYEPNYNIADVARDGEITQELVISATDWYFNNHPSEKRSDYDSDNNYFFDCVMLIYAAPDYQALRKDDYDNLWAYCYWLQNEKTSKVTPNVFFWASYDFMYSQGADAYNRTDHPYGNGDTTHCNIDAHTYIHEMGHVFGLDDYYDYSSADYSPAGMFSMQDSNVGAHDPYSVMALGWADPYVVTGNSEVTIGVFQKTKDLVVISPKWNGIGSPFDEYIILELFSNTGLNEFDCTYAYGNNSDLKGPESFGIRMWHVDSRLTYVNQTKYDPNLAADVYVFNARNMTSDTQIAKKRTDTYGVTHAFTNTYNNENYGSVLGRDYYDYNLLQLIRNSAFESYHTKDNFSTDDLFYTGQYDLTYYANQFVKGKNKKFNNGESLDWSIKIKISGRGEDTTAKIDIIKN